MVRPRYPVFFHYLYCHKMKASRLKRLSKKDLTCSLTLFLYIPNQKGKRKARGVPQSQARTLPRNQEEEETDKLKRAQIEQTYEKD